MLRTLISIVAGFSLHAVCCLSLPPTALGQTADSPERPNIILVLVDDMGWGDLGVYHQNDSKHDKRHRTPMLDRMANEGVQLRQHYCPAPVCAPSRASLLTGVHQGNAVVRDNQFDKMLEDNHTLGTVMQQAGYRTALIGKYGLQGRGDSAENWPGYPTKRGFDEFYGYVRHVDGHVHYPADHWPLGNNDNHRSPKEVWHNGKEISSGLTKCYTTDLFTARSKHWIREHTEENANQPFFLYLAYDTPHAALQIPTMEYPEGQGLNGGLQWLGTPGKMINTAEGKIDSYRHPDYVGRGWSDVQERFATMVRRIDDGMGDLLQTLRDLEIAKNTLVVFSSDNGPHKEAYMSAAYHPTSFQSYGPFDGIKRDTWEGGIRVPTLAWWPGKIEAGSIDGRPSQFHDWMPTFADVAGIVAPARSDGVSLRPRWSGNDEAAESRVYVEYFQGGRTPNYDDFDEHHRGRKRGQQQMILLDGYKGVRLDIQSHSDPFEIYDLSDDPGESRNLAGSDPKFDALQQRMHDRVLQIRRPNDSATRPYDDQPMPAVESDESLQAGMLYRFFSGDFDYAPQVHGLSASATGIIASFQHLEPMASPGVFELSGYLKVEHAGLYQVQLSSQQRAFLRIHEAPLLDADFGYQAGETLEADVRLAAGLHPVRLICLCSEDERPEIGLQWSSDSAPAPTWVH